MTAIELLSAVVNVLTKCPSKTTTAMITSTRTIRDAPIPHIQPIPTAALPLRDNEHRHQPGRDAIRIQRHRCLEEAGTSTGKRPGGSRG
jgi:hypothetical protein